MKAVIQRVREADVQVEGRSVGRIGRGLLVYIGVAVDDRPENADRLAEKVAHLRIFPDADGKLNLSVQDARGGVLAVPNFTLQADARKGRRPAFVNAAKGDVAEPLHDRFVEALKGWVQPVETGLFGADMQIRSIADGPINILLEMT